MFVKFNHTWGKYFPGDVAEIELTLSRRLQGMGICEYKTDMHKKTTPEIIIEEPVVEEVEEKEVEVEEKPEPVEEKTPPKRKYKRTEKAVSIEK